jgi:hypothetical protein
MVQVHNNCIRNASYVQWYPVKNLDVIRKHIWCENQMAGRIPGM